jgi:hypothetical protein
MEKKKKTEDRYFSLPWSYSLLKSSLHSIVLLNFLQTFKTVKLTRCYDIRLVHYCRLAYS